MKGTKEQKGITLIALIITIVVLLILVAVAISSIQNDGILHYAQNAAETYQTSQEKEKSELDVIEGFLASYSDQWSGKVGTGFASGGGLTKEDPYIIENAEQLAYFASQVNAGETFEGKFIKITKTINLGDKEFTPIGMGSTGTKGDTEWNFTERYFNGTLDGNGKTISGVKITQTNMHGVGIIGVLGEKGLVENLNVNRGTIIGKTCVGGIVGASKGKIVNCTNKLTIIAQDDDTLNSGQMAGGIVGFLAKGSIENCENYGDITTKDDRVLTGRGKHAGGIVGFCFSEEDIIISNCINNGKVIAVYQQAGGIVGCNFIPTATLTIKECTNTGKISTVDSGGALANNMAGGIIGWASGKTDIIDCVNSGAVSTDYLQAGGIAGRIVAGTISDCVNSGAVSAGNQQAAGIAGKIDAGTISKCENSGEVSAELYSAGGIVGWQLDGTISDCVNSGAVSAGTQQVGGIVGIQQDGTISDCVNSGAVSAGKQSAGGIVGVLMDGTISDCENIGNVIAKAVDGKGIAGGIVGYQLGGAILNVYNTAPVAVGNKDGIIDAIGGIIGLQKGGSLSKCYNKGILTGGEAIGGVVGQKQLPPTIENAYYYTTQNIKGIGSESDINTEIIAVEDVSGKVEKTTKDIDSLENFLNAQMP